MSDLATGFPKNLAYSIKELSGFSKQSIKVLSDRYTSTAANGDTIKFKLPPNSLIDLSTISIFYEFTVTGSTLNQDFHHPRLSSSIIEQMNIIVNGVQISAINNYNLLYNTLFDLEAGIDNNNKRFLEVIDPSVIYKADTTTNNLITAYRATANNSGAGNDTSRPCAINNFVGFLSSSSTRVIDTNDLGDVIIEIRLASPNICWGSAPGASTSGISTTPSWTIGNIRMTMSRINFASSEYYELKAAKLLDAGLQIGFYDYIFAKGTLQTKGNIAFNYNVNANSLDQIIGTFQRADFNTTNTLVLAFSSNITGGTTNFNNGVTITTANVNLSFMEVVANPQLGFTSSAQQGYYGLGDAFNQSKYFQRAGNGLTTSQYIVNSVMMNPYQLPPEEIWNENLIALGLHNIDMNSGCHPGLRSLADFLKYYFCHILSLENLSGDNQFWRSGLDGKAASINVQWNTTFGTNNTDQVYPVTFNRCTKIITVQAGRLISVV